MKTAGNPLERALRIEAESANRRAATGREGRRGVLGLLLFER